MAEIVDEGEFWLPSEFLPDDIFTAEKTQVEETKGGGGLGGVCFPSEFPYDYESSSPVESMTETESDEEEYMAGLTRRMAHSFLYDDDNNNSLAFSSTNNESSMACSPESPLCAIGTWSSKVVPTPKILPPDATTWDLLYAAAGQVVRMRQDQEAEQQRVAAAASVGGGRGLLGLPRKPSPPVSSNATNTTGYFANPPLTHHQLQINQFYQLKQQQILKQQLQHQQGTGGWGRQNRGRNGMGMGANNNNNSRVGSQPLGGLSSTAWPPLQHQPSNNGSGMRAVFLGTPGARKQSCGGTGVFLPRRVGSPADSRKKPGCSTVLLPARVVQALNLNLEEIGAQSRFPGGFVLDHETIMARNNAMLSQKKSSIRPQHPAGVNHHEVRLPPEWTY